MTSLWRDLRPVLALLLGARRRALLAGALLAAATVLAGLALLGLSGWFITATALAGLSVATALSFDVFAPAAGIRFLALARTAARYGERLATHDATLGVLADLRERLFRGFAEPGAARALLMRPATLLFRLTADIDALDSLYLRLLVPAGAALAAALATGLALGLMHPLLGLAAAVFLLASGLGIPIGAARRAAGPAGARSDALEALRAHAVDLVAGQTDLVMAGRLAAAKAALAADDRRLAAADDRLSRVEAGVTAAFGVAAAFLLAGTLAAVAGLAETGAITAPVAALAVLVALAAVEPFAGLRRGAVEFGRTRLAARRVGPRLAPVAPAHRPLPPRTGAAVRLSGATVRHEDAGSPAIENASLLLRRGEHVALVGPSGAGKSTLLALLAGEIAAEAGEVEALPATLLTQRTELFQDTLRGNLRLAASGADDARLLEALAAAGLGRDVATLAAGLDTRLGEGGLGLSGGQARRLALARLFLRDTPLWLLDEPTEGLDGATARDVMRRLAARAAGRAVLVATHIQREAAFADRLVVLDHGRILASLPRGEPPFDAALARLRPD